MFKKLLAAALVLAVIAGTSQAEAQDTIGLYADFGEGGELSRSLITKPGTPFDVVVVTKTDFGSNFSQFVMTALPMLYPGVFKFWTTRVTGSTLDFGNQDVGEHSVTYMSCLQAGTAEVVRIRYADLSGTLGPNVVLSLRGVGPGDSILPAFGGEMGYVDCARTAGDQTTGNHVLTPEPWDSSSNVDPTRISGVQSTNGILVLNPAGDAVPTASDSIGLLKSRFQR